MKSGKRKIVGDRRLAVDGEILLPRMWALDHPCYIRVLYPTKEAAEARNSYKYGGSGRVTMISTGIHRLLPSCLTTKQSRRGGKGKSK